MTEVFVGLGTNLGDRLQLMRAAIHCLGQYVDERHVSPVYETAPVGYLDQPWFLNAVVAGNTDLGPDQLLSRLHAIEEELGRERSFLNAPRTIDLDLLFYGDLVVESENLILPHPRLHERLFVLVPLAEIAPTFVHPLLGRTVSELKEGIEDEWAGVRVNADFSDIIASQSNESNAE